MADTPGNDSTQTGGALPEKYEFKLPEGVTLDEPRITALGSTAKELKLPQDAAQKLTDLAFAKDLTAEQRAEKVTALATELKVTPEVAKKFLDAANPPKANDGPPEKYEFKAPEGVKLDETRVKAFTDVARELKLSQAGAQKLVDMAIAHATADQAARDAALETQRKTWVDAVKADKEIGGTNFEANANLARKAVAKFATPELRTILDSGWGDHPAFVKMFVAIGKALGEDTTVDGAGAQAKEKSAAETLYPSQGKK